MLVVVMGVSGSGKTTLGKALAERLGIAFVEADEFHPPANIESMRAGRPLTNAQRLPWIDALADEVNRLIDAAPSDPREPRAVLACSALSDVVRARLRTRVRTPVFWAHLQGDEALIRQRLDQRRGHYMPSTLLASQFAALEAPDDALPLDCADSPSQQLDAVLAALAGLPR